MFYDYFCKKCGKEKEVIHSIKDKPVILCECGETMKVKITGGCGEIYTGLGWPRKGTGTAPTPKRVTERRLVGPPPKRRK